MRKAAVLSASRLFLFASLLFLLCGCGADGKSCSGESGSGADGESGETDIYNCIRKLENPEDYIILGNYKDISIAKTVVDGEAVAAYKKSLREEHAYHKALDKDTVEAGDCVNVSFTSYLNGEAFEGGSGSDDFTVGEGEFVFPEAENALVGIKTGGTASLDVTVPDDYFSTGLRGKVIRMDITVKQIQEKEKTLPEIDAAFVKEHFGLDSLEAFGEYAKKELEEKAEDEMMSEAWNAALANCEIIEYPDSVIDRYVEEMLSHYTEQAAKYGAGAEIFIGDDLEKWKEQARKYAGDYYKSEIAMFAILDREFGREISAGEYARRREGYAKDLGISEKELEEKYGEDALKNNMYWDKVMELIWENCEKTG